MSGVISEKDSRRCRECKGDGRGLRRNEARPAHDACNGQRQSYADKHSNESAQHAQDHGLRQELHPDVASPGTDGHPYTDLACSLRHRHEHDIHDSDSSHQQRDSGNAAQQESHDSRRGFRSFGNFGEIIDPEIVRLSLSNGVPFPKQFGDLIFGCSCCSWANRRNRDAVNSRYRAVRHLLLNCRVRHDREVVLILTGRRLTLRGEDADDTVGQVANADGLAHRIAALEEVVGDGLPQYDDSVRRTHIGLGKEVTLIDFQAADLQIVFVRSFHAGLPVLISEYKLALSLGNWSNEFYGWDFALNGLDITFCQRLLISALSCAAATRVPAATTLDLQDVLTHPGNLVLNELLSSLTERHHGDHGGDANHNTQHGQCGLDLVLAEGVNGHLLNIKESHS